MREAVAAAVEVVRVFGSGPTAVRALNGVSFSVGRGEMALVRGRSGSGKTTLLNILGGLDRPTSGQVLIEGRDLATLPDGELTRLRRHRIGFIFQSFGLIPVLTAYENVDLVLRVAGVRGRERARRAHEYLEMVGLARRLHHRPYELSGGEQQRVAIARALANRPALLLADEPTGELDSQTGWAVLNLLREIVAAEGVSIVLASHDPAAADAATRVYEIVDGRIAEMEVTAFLNEAGPARPRSA